MTMRIFCALLRVGLLVACVPPASSDKPFSFVPLPNLSHSFRGDGLVAVLSASVGYFTCCFAGPTALPAAMTLSGNSMSVTEDAQRVPLEVAVNDLEPRDVWQNFYRLTQIPRPSGHDEQVRAFLVQFGQQTGFETSVDEVGNVLMRKPTALGTNH